MTDNPTHPIPRSNEVILDRINMLKPIDVFGDEWTELIYGLTWESAQPFLKQPVSIDRQTWEDRRGVEFTTATITEYLPFAFEKVLDHRGLSSMRSVSHFRAWCWLLGDETFSKINWNLEERYPQYGAPIIANVAEVFGVDQPTGQAWANMKQGFPCTEDCEQGCE